MKTYIFILFASILLFPNSLLAYRIYPYSYERDQKSIPASKMMMIVPIEDNMIWPQYDLPSLYQDLDSK